MKLTIKQDVSEILEIKKSKFIGYAFFCADVDEANKYLESVRLEHKKATHVCYAYVVNSNEKASDDGEPQGTAGIPILEIIKKRKLTNVLVIVVRYFGGIKLGAGGLVRAYGESAGLALNSAATTNLIEATEFSVSLNYGEEGVLNTIKNTAGVYDLKFEYSDKINITFLANTELEVLNGLNVLKGETKLVRV